MSTANNTPPVQESLAPDAPGQGSLLRPEEFGPLSLKYRRSPGDMLRAARDSLRLMAQRKGVRRLALLLVLILAIGLPIWAYLELRVRPAPDYALDEIEDVLDYTLLSDDFNKLPIDQRLALIKNLINRLKSMDSGDSELMAAFAAGITAKGREQMRVNGERLAVDLWGSYSDKYHDVPSEKKSEYLDNAFLEFSKLMEDVAGIDNKKTDNERLADARKQAKRDADQARNNLGPIPENAGRMMKMMQDRGEKVSNPVQQARMVRFTRDMVHHLRGQDGSGEPPAAPGSPGAPGDPAANPDPNQPGDQPPDEQKPDDEKKKDEKKKPDEKKKDPKKKSQKPGPIPTKKDEPKKEEPKPDEPKPAEPAAPPGGG